MESSKGWSQEPSEARTRLALPRGPVVQPPPRPGKTPVPPPPAPPRGAGAPHAVPGAAGAQTKWLFTPNLPARSRSTPRPRAAHTPKHPSEHPRGDSSLPAPRPPGATSCQCPALISSPSRKTRGKLAGWQLALIVPPFPSPWHGPATQPVCLPTGKTTLRPLLTGGAPQHPPRPPSPRGRAAPVTSLCPATRRRVGVCTTPLSPPRCHRPQRGAESS